MNNTEEIASASVGSDDPLMNAEGAAKYLGVSPGTLHNWRSAKKGPDWIRLGGAVRYRKSGLDRYCEANTVSNGGRPRKMA